MIHATDRELLIAATATTRQRMADHERDSWPAAERDDGPVHVSVVIGEWLRMRGLSEQYAEWRARHGESHTTESALTRCGEGV